MVALNQQEFVNNKVLVIVTLAGSAEASISAGPVGKPSHPQRVSIQAYLDAGLSELDALKEVLKIAKIAVAGATA